MVQFVLALFLAGGLGMKLEWSELSIHFYGPVDMASDSFYESELKVSLDSLLAAIPLDAEHTLGDVVRRSNDARNYFITSLAYPQVVSTRYSTSGEVQNEYVISLFGPFLEDFIPHSNYVNVTENPDTTSGIGSEVQSSIPVTGFVIDARGIGFNPAIFPRIVDPQGNVILDAGRVNRARLMEDGYVRYAYSPREVLETRELGLNPLRIVAERAEGRNRSNLVLNYEDASRITSSALNLRLLSECRVIIIIDRY
jgi:hypothetical protein